MTKQVLLVFIAMWAAAPSQPVCAVSPTAEEMAAAQHWVAASFMGNGPADPSKKHWFTQADESFFSFVCDGKPSREFLKTCECQRSKRSLDENRVEHTTTYTDSKTGLVVRCVGVEHRHFPTVEWTVYLKNTGTADSPFIDNLYALDIGLKRGLPDEFLLRHSAGSWAGAAAYALYETPLPHGTLQRISAYGGRPSNTDMPYFNLEWGGQGIVLAVGWPGQWKAEFHRDDHEGLHITSGQELTHFKLHPGEEVRTPLIALQFWKGGWVDAQNVWRRWMNECNLPRPGGKPVPPIFSGQAGYANSWMYEATEENQKAFLDRFLEIGIQVDHWWMDTGWFYAQGVPQNQWTPEMQILNKNGRLWEKFNIWEVNKVRFPHGIKAVSDHAHAKGVKTILWFEPERVTPDSWPEHQHPEWCLKASTTPQMLLDLGNAEARKWITDRVHDVLTAEDIDVYRSDFNMDPLDHWRQNDAADRQGITENHWVTGYLTFWDELLRRNPKLLIDSCASGGRRNDLETMRRSVPLWKSDYAIEPVGMQCQLYGLAFWLPYFGNCGGQMDPYVFRSNMNPAIAKGTWEDRTPGHDVRDKKQDYNRLLQMIGQWRQMAGNYAGNYYPLTPYSVANDVWMAWQFDRPEQGEGMVQAFRREKCEAGSLCVKLRGLEPDAVYVLTDVDKPGTTELTGRELQDKGLSIASEQPRSAVIVTYRKKT
jgi:alpha-galactosidase